jgi:aminopeptidase N
LKIYLAFLFLLCTVCSAQRLPKIAVPEHYTLKLDPDLKSGDLSGEEEIRLRLLKPTRTLVLNAVGLRLQKISLAAGKESLTGIATVAPVKEMIEITFPQRIPAGPATLKLSYAGKIRNDLKGLYLSRTARRSYAVTQFEGTYARMMFPSFDEPGYKATFDVSVVIDEGDTAISNAAIAADTPGPRAGKHTVRFGTSPKMSTYLVALAIGDWKCSEGGVDGIPIRICALPEKVPLTTYALHAAERFIHFYNGYYSIKYPFKKLDMVAIPDYEWGGMENTASVFYKERALLVDEKTAGIAAKRGVASVIAHEIAHQWFGDLVTMAWWNDVWLNEGFATWMTPKALEDWDPAWDQKPEVALRKTGVLEADARVSTRAIRANGKTPAEIKQLFDGIAYEKGAAVLHMVEAYLGPKMFRDGINSYLQRNANGNATSEDFWRELERVSGKPVSRIMESFVKQPGAPMVSAVCGTSGCTFSQERYSLKDGRNSTWNIPVCTRSLPDGHAQCEVMSGRQQKFPSLNGTFLLNAGATGYYRSAYTPEQLTAIRKQWPAVTAAERIAILDDAWAMVRAAQANLTDYLELGTTLRSETQPAVFQTVVPRLRSIRKLLTGEQTAKFDAWVLKDLPEQTAIKIDSDEARSWRALVFEARSEAGDQKALAESDAITARFLHDPASVDPTLATTALHVAAEHGDAALYESFQEKMKMAATPELSFRYLTLLTAFRDPKLIDRTLALVASSDLREQDVPFLLAGLLHNPAARDKAWQLLQDRWNELSRKIVSFGGSGPIAALGEYCSDDDMTAIKRFLDKHPLPGAERSARGALEQISGCVALKKTQGPALEQWLAAH